jgi:DNA polymerase
LLDWQLACGVDIALDDAPHDRYAESAGRSNDAPETKSIPTRAVNISLPAAPPFPEEATRLATAAASAAVDLQDLEARFAGFDGCAFKSMATHFLFAAGTTGARLMAFDFAPGEEEERSGEPFSGQAAALLDNMLAAIGHDRKTSYLAYFSPWRPPGDKTASAADEAALLPFARRHIELAAPDVLLIFGEPTARALLQTNLSGAQLRGRWFDCATGTVTTRAIVLPSLAHVLKNPMMKRNIWRDLQMVAAALRGA